MVWKKEEIEVAINLFENGKNFKQIGKLIGKSQGAVTKKLNRLGYKYWDDDAVIDRETKNVDLENNCKCKYKYLEWESICKDYENGMSQRDLMIKYKLPYQALKWGKDNEKIKFRNNYEAIILAIKQGKMLWRTSKKTGIERYRQLCEFKFGIKNFPEYFNFKLIENYGWYKAKNNGNNLNGVSRDHMYSINDGFLNGIHPIIISHPANCELMPQQMNSKKNAKSSISLEKLLEKIKIFENVYKTKNKDDVFEEIHKMEIGIKTELNLFYKGSDTQKINKNLLIKENKVIYYCSRCKKETKKRSNVCVKCSQIKQRRVERPPYEQLLQEIKGTSYVAVGEKYGVSDNAIRKWIKNYEKEIK
jgi:hypothetical protein